MLPKASITLDASILSDKPQMEKSKTPSDDHLKVCIRIRPPLLREIEPNLPFRSIAVVSQNSQISLVEYLGCSYSEADRQREWIENPNYFQYHRFTFDRIFDIDSTQDEVYAISALPAVESVLSGYNSTIFAYGQTGTGKTFTMEGFTFDYLDPNRGIIPRTIEDIFKYIENNTNSNTTFIIRATYLQIYNEQISDLLKPEKKNLSIRESKQKGLYVESLSEWAVRSPNDIYALLERGSQSRAKANTHMNDVSSRSHAVFSIQVEQMENGQSGKSIKVGKLNLVDLAGSERIKVSGATGQQLEESKKINKSLSALGNVIYALTDSKGRTHIPYRDSKLTRLLENSLGGNCRTTMIGMISPAECSFSESLSTLNFAKRAKSIKNRAIVNEDIDHNALIRQYENELKKLRKELEEKDRLLRDNNFIMELEEQKKEAERDKNEAIQALEEASIKYLQERDEKKKLENKIQLMNFQMIPGGQKISIEETPQFQDLLQKHQILLEKDFQEKLDEIEQEREALAASKEQVDSYNKLLSRQRNIMVGLTTSLNERDENIAQLQEEIEAYEKMSKDMEENNKIKDKRILLLEDLLRKNNIDVPEREKENEIEKVVSKVNNEEKNKSLNNKKQKLYMKYIDNNLDIDDKNNDKINENDINIMLTPEEKINELTGIIKEKEKEISIMKKVSNKIYNKTLSTSTENFTKENNDENNNKTQPLRKRKNALEIISQLNDLKSKYSMNESFSKDIAEIINKLDNKEEEDESQTKNSSSSNINVKNTNITFKPIISNNVGISHPENTIKGIKITPYKKEKENGK